MTDGIDEDQHLPLLNSTDFPREPVEWHANHDTTDIVTFLCKEEEEQLLPKPISAAAHIEQNTENYQRNTSLRKDVRGYLESGTNIESFLKTGWILSRPTKNIFDTRPGEPEVSGQRSGHRTSPNETKNPFNTTQRYGKQVAVDTHWAAEVKDGYSLLIIHPACVPKNRFHVLPTILDMDRVNRSIKVPIKLRFDELWKSHYGQPVAQVIPIPRELLKVEYQTPTSE